MSDISRRVSLQQSISWNVQKPDEAKIIWIKNNKNDKKYNCQKDI